MDFIRRNMQKPRAAGESIFKTFGVQVLISQYGRPRLQPSRA
jgi:hypothetical protein